MSTFDGALLPSAIYADAAYGAPYKFLPAPLTLPYPGSLASAPPAAGVFSDELPITENADALDGFVARQFEQDWYHRVHLLPARIELGNLLSTQVRQVEVWNAHFSAQTLSALDAENDGGVTLSAPHVPPTLYGMLESRLHDVSVSLDGPPVIDARYTFHFTNESPVLAITGRRVVVFALKPNWADGWLERLAWATDVLTARDGSEQRVRLRRQPRRSLEFSILAGRDDAALVDILLAAWQSRVYALPVWPDRRFVATEVSAGSTVVPVTTANLEYEADGLLVIGTDSRETEAAEVLSVADGAVTLKTPLLRTWPAGAFVAPARTVRLRASQPLSRVTDAVATTRLVFDVASETTIAPQDGVATFQSLPLWPAWLRPNRAREVDVEYRRLAEMLDFETGIVAVDDHAARPFMRRGFDYVFEGRPAIAALRGWLAARAGRLCAFWHPTWEASIVPVRKILAAQTVMTVAARGYALYFDGLPGRTEVALRHKNGNWYVRAIQNFGAGLDETEEVMMLDQSFGFDAEPADWLEIHFLEKTRLDTDQVELSWVTDSVLETTLPMISTAS